MEVVVDTVPGLAFPVPHATTFSLISGEDHQGKSIWGEPSKGGPPGRGLLGEGLWEPQAFFHQSLQSGLAHGSPALALEPNPTPAYCFFVP